jgi:hypothetical protein
MQMASKHSYILVVLLTAAILYVLVVLLPADIYTS